MRYLFGFLCVCALGVVSVVGCGGDGDPCEGVRCDDSNECTGDECVDGACEFPPVEDDTPCRDDGNECTVEMCASGVCASMPVEDGTQCGDGAGACQGAICSAVEGTFACTEQGIREAVAVGGGPFTFDCDGPETVTTEAEIVIGKDVILDGEGNLRVDGNGRHSVFNLPRAVTATLSGMTITGGYILAGNGGGIATGGTLTLHHSMISGNTAQNSGNYIRGHGGGIYSTGRLTLNDSTMSGNLAIPTCPPLTAGSFVAVPVVAATISPTKVER